MSLRAAHVLYARSLDGPRRGRTHLIQRGMSQAVVPGARARRQKDDAASRSRVRGEENVMCIIMLEGGGGVTASMTGLHRSRR